jgi:hypothetical protein
MNQEAILTLETGLSEPKPPPRPSVEHIPSPGWSARGGRCRRSIDAAPTRFLAKETMASAPEPAASTRAAQGVIDLVALVKLGEASRLLAEPGRTPVR